MDDTTGIFYPPGGRIAIVEGTVVPTGGERLSPSEISRQIREVVAMPYMGRDVDKIGMTLLEAALFSAAKAAADGDVDALNKLLDRLVGKPVQQTVVATGTLAEFLNQIAQNEGGGKSGPHTGPTIDIDAVGL
jgi:hypothetical protein